MSPRPPSGLVRRSLSVLVLLSLVLIALAGCGSPQQQAVRALEEAETSGAFQGVALVIGDADTLALATSAAVAGQEALTLDRPVPLASLSKLVTATMILRLADQGRIDLDAPLAHYRPRLPSDLAGRITVRELLAHRAGLPREVGGALEPVYVRYDSDGFAGPHLDRQVLTVQPSDSSRASYSNWGYWLLGSVIEATMNQPLPEAMHRLLPGAEIHVPAGPNSTWVAGYAADGRPADAVDVAGRYTSGGFVATPAAWFAFLDGLRSGPWLSAASRELLFTDFGYAPDRTDPLLIAAHLPGFSHLTMLDRDGRAVMLLNNRTVDPLDDVLTLGQTLARAAGMTLAESSGDKQVFRTMDSYAEADHPLSDAILAMAHAIGTENADSIAAVIQAHYDLEEFGPEERANDLALLPKLPAAMGGWAVRAWRVADEGDVPWIYLLMRTDEEVSDEDADAQFILGMAARERAPDKVFHVFYHFDGFKVKD